MRRTFLCVAGAVVWVCGAAVPLKAQVDAGAVNGNVTDNTGAIIPGAKVVLHGTATGQTMVTTTGKDGDFTFSPVKIGDYTVTVDQAGFRESVDNITVSIQQHVRADFKLIPGGVTQRVEVTSLAPQMQTEDASVGYVATQAQIQQLPLNGRNYTFLAQLDPGVTSLKATRGLDATGSFVANGLTSVHNDYILDGIDNNNDTVDFLNGTAYVDLPPPDAIQQFKLQTSNFSAEFGRAGGAVVNASIKSGTNQFHGSAWEFLRNNAFDAMPLGQYFVNPANRVHTPYKWNQFGASAGFPIVKDKLFVFGDYEGMRIRQAASLSASVPTAAEASSGYTDFSDRFQYNATSTLQDNLGRTFNIETIFDPATTRAVTQGSVDPVTGLTATKSGYVRDPFYTGGTIAGITNFTTLQSHLNQLPANRLDANAIKLLKLMPAANQSGTNQFVNNYHVNQAEPDNRNHFDVRVDFNLSSKDQMFGRFSYGKRSAYIPSVIDGLGANPGFGSGNFVDDSNNYALSETHSFSATLINEARFGYSHLYTSAQPSVSSQQGIAGQFGIQGIPDGANNGGLPNIDTQGFASLGPGGYASPNNRTSNTIQATDNLTKTWGKQSLRMGGEYQHLTFPWECPPYPRGYFEFGASGGGYYTTVPGANGGVGAADLLLSPIASTVTNAATGVQGVDYVGGPSYVVASSISLSNDRRSYFGAYLQDDWKVSSKLTVNLGLRWESFLALQDANKQQAGLIVSDDLQSAQYEILSAQKNTPLAPSFVALLAKDKIPLNYVDRSGLLSSQKANFAPRVGLAYLLTPKLVLRASYGMFYGGFENIGGAPDPSQNYPFSVYLGVSAPDPSHPLLYGDGTRATLETGLSHFEPDPNNPAFNPEYLGPIAYQQNPKTPYTQEWNAAVQYELSPNQTVTLGYVGNNSLHMLNGSYINQPTEILPTSVSPQPYVQFPDLARNLNYMANNGASYYHGLQVSFERRMSNGLQFMANYTRSVCMSDNRNILNIGEGTSARAYLLPGWGIHKDYQYCGDDVRDIFHASGIYDLPVGRGRMFATNLGRPVEAVVGGWSLQGIYTLQDGFPGTINCPYSTTSDYGCYAPLVSGQDVYANTSTAKGRQFLNPAAFGLPPVATSIGQSDTAPLGGGGQQFQGPDYNDVDLSLFKRFAFNEHSNLELRAEAFNAFNHPNFSNSFLSNDYRNTALFGVLNGTRGNARELQLAVKLHW